MFFARFAAGAFVLAASITATALPLSVGDSSISAGEHQRVFESSEWIRAALWLARTPSVFIDIVLSFIGNTKTTLDYFNRATVHGGQPERPNPRRQRCSRLSCSRSSQLISLCRALYIIWGFPLNMDACSISTA